MFRRQGRVDGRWQPSVERFAEGSPISGPKSCLVSSTRHCRRYTAGSAAGFVGEHPVDATQGERKGAVMFGDEMIDEASPKVAVKLVSRGSGPDDPDDGFGSTRGFDSRTGVP